MSDFQYLPFVNPYAASMADEIAHAADAHARAAEIVGQAQARAAEIKGAGWGRALENIGQIPTQVAQTQALQTDRKLREQELAMTIEQRQVAQAQRVATLAGRIAGVSRTPEEMASNIDQAASSGLLPAEIAQHMKANLAAVGADPTQFRAHRQSLMDFADSFQAPITLGKDATLLRPSVDPTKPVTPIATGVREPLKGGPGDRFFTPPDPNAPPGTPLTEVGAVPNKPIAINGTILNPDQAVGTTVPKQETPSEVAERQAQTLKLQREAQELDQRLSGTAPLQPKDRAELELRRAQIALETARNDRMERKESPDDPRYQSQLETQYRVLARAVIQTRSGALGIEDQKVTAAKHLITMFNANTDANGNINIPPQQYQELAMGLATLVNPKGTPTEAEIRDLKAATARGDLGKLAQYISGSNFNGTTQEIVKYLRDQIERQGLQAEANREKELDFIRSSRPTDLQPSRAEGIEHGLAGLNRMADVGVGPGGHAVGDTVTYQGKTYRIKAIQDGKAVLEEAR